MSPRELQERRRIIRNTYAPAPEFTPLHDKDRDQNTCKCCLLVDADRSIPAERRTRVLSSMIKRFERTFGKEINHVG